MKRLSAPFRGIGNRVSLALPGIEYDLKLIDCPYTPGEYILVVFYNSLLWALLILAFMFFLFYMQGNIGAADFAAATSSLDGLFSKVLEFNSIFFAPIATFTLLSIFFLRYPKVLAGKLVEALDKDLIYALRDLLVQINSGVTLYDAMVGVSQSGYGSVSKQFETVVQDINVGQSQEAALERMALRTKSDFLHRAVWQIVTAMKAGASLKAALASVLSALRNFQSARVKMYTQELNLWILLYVMVAVTVPSLGVTLLVILSTFAGVGINDFLIVMLIFICFISEFLLIEFIKVRRPVIKV